MNCNAVPLQSPVSHSAHWVEMDKNNEPQRDGGKRVQSAERGRLTTKGTKNPKGEAPKGGNQEFEMDHGWGEEFRVQRGKG